jgi:S-adenosylmethionine:tRNA ribosyltransferase-isomerase
MSPATWPRENPLEERLLWLDPAKGAFGAARVRELPKRLRAGDLLVVNDAATLPASLRAKGPKGAPLELRLLRQTGAATFWAVLFGEGDWRSRTEDRPPPPPLRPGDGLRVGPMGAEVLSLSDISYRLLELRFDRSGEALLRALYETGRPVQYSYLKGELSLWHVQTSYAARPWAMELPSAGRPLTFGLLQELRARGVGLASLTHAAGLSSTGDPALDAALPFPERFEIPEGTVRAIQATRGRGGRIVAVGTTVVRALEGSAARFGAPRAGAGETDLKLGPRSRLRVVDGLFSGMHEPGTSHYQLLLAFVPEALLGRASAFAEQEGFLGHEFGDSTLILSD